MGAAAPKREPRVGDTSVRLVETRLDGLAVGEHGTLGAPDAVDPTIVRLLEMGFTEGAEVRLVRRAPLGDPLEVLVRGTRVCLRKADAAKFPVHRLKSGAARE